MAYCKRCVCGHVNIYEQMGRSPLRCTKCRRFIAAVTEEVYEEQPQQEETAEEKTPEITETPVPGEGGQPEQPRGFAITLESPEGDFVLPVTELITVGRNASGMKYLEHYADVSREHFTIEPRFNGISATLTDMSTFGTCVNGVRMVKGTSVAVSNSTVLRLGNHAIMIVRVREVGSDA